MEQPFEEKPQFAKAQLLLANLPARIREIVTQFRERHPAQWEVYEEVIAEYYDAKITELEFEKRMELARQLNHYTFDLAYNLRHGKPEAGKFVYDEENTKPSETQAPFPLQNDNYETLMAAKSKETIQEAVTLTMSGMMNIGRSSKTTHEAFADFARHHLHEKKTAINPDEFHAVVADMVVSGGIALGNTDTTTVFGDLTAKDAAKQASNGIKAGGAAGKLVEKEMQALMDGVYDAVPDSIKQLSAKLSNDFTGLLALLKKTGNVIIVNNSKYDLEVGEYYADHGKICSSCKTIPKRIDIPAFKDIPGDTRVVAGAITVVSRNGAAVGPQVGFEIKAKDDSGKKIKDLAVAVTVPVSHSNKIFATDQGAKYAAKNVPSKGNSDCSDTWKLNDFEIETRCFSKHDSEDHCYFIVVVNDSKKK